MKLKVLDEVVQLSDLSFGLTWTPERLQNSNCSTVRCDVMSYSSR